MELSSSVPKYFSTDSEFSSVVGLIFALLLSHKFHETNASALALSLSPSLSSIDQPPTFA